MKKNLVPLLGIAFVVALIATGIFYGLFVGKLRGSASDSPRYAVVVAAKSLARGTVVQAADLKMNPWTGPEAPKGAFLNVDQVVGFTVLEPIAANEPVAESRMASHHSIPPGMRGISIHVTDSSGIVPMLRPGNKVDVQVVGSNGAEVGLRTILQNIEVLSIATPDNNRLVVNLLVSPLDAELLGLADSAARIRLVLRNPSDDGRSLQTTLPVSNLMRRTASEQVTPVSAPRDAGPKITAVLPPR